MNKERFSSIQEQLSPSEEAVSSLKDQLSKAQKKRPAPWKYGAVAACAALALAAVPIYQHLLPLTPPALHSYVTDADSGPIHTESAAAADTIFTGGGVEDLGATDNQNEDNGPNGGKPIDAPDSSSYVTADAPADEEAGRLYQNLMAQFQTDYGPDTYPQWYGGGYLAGSGQLMVLIVEEFEPEDKELYFQIFDWAGGDNIGFGSAKYSLNHLQGLQDQVVALPELKNLSGWGCGVYEMENRLVLNVPEASPALLAALAQLDPEDDAILVRTGAAISTTDDIASVEEPVSHLAVQPGGVQDLDGDAPVSSPAPDIARDDIAHYDILPEELPQAKYGQDTPSYDPNNN